LFLKYGRVIFSLNESYTQNDSMTIKGDEQN
jgi:hypothetical protein